LKIANDVLHIIINGIKPVKIIGRYKGMLGEIAIWESEKTGDRLYREGEIFQSQSSVRPEGAGFPM